MEDFRNIEIQTVEKVITSNTLALTIGGQVPSQKKRFVTFIMWDTLNSARMSDNKLYLASVGVSNPTLASVIATGNRKYVGMVEGTQMSRSSKDRPIMFPKTGHDVRNPVFTIAGGKWLGVVSSLTTAHLFVQYYDV